MHPSHLKNMPFLPDYSNGYFVPNDLQKRHQDQKKFQQKVIPHKMRGLSDSPERKGSPLLNVESMSWRPYNDNHSPSPLNQQFEGNSTDVTHSSIHTESLNLQGAMSFLCEHLDLTSFKLKPCIKPNQHNHKHCPFYHNNKDRKRPGNFYSSDLCEYIERGEICLMAENCSRSHNRVEQLYRPEKYKTKFCTYYPNNIMNCEYGPFCSFAHNESEISIELIHNLEFDDDFFIFYFKTVWCPFNLAHHDRALCVYAHNWQDYRRKPQLVNYENLPCPRWKSTEFIGNYEDGCPEGAGCQKCHGWKENEFHPLNYKTKACQSGGRNCMKGRNCPQYHHMGEKRTIVPNVQSKIFRLIPKNRIITNTFKYRSEREVGSQSNNSLTSSRRSTVQSIPSPQMPIQDLFTGSENNLSLIESRIMYQQKLSSTCEHTSQLLQQIPSPERKDNRRLSLTDNLNPAFKVPSDRKLSLQPGVNPLTSILERPKQSDEISGVESEDDEKDEDSESSPDQETGSIKKENYQIKYRNDSSSSKSGKSGKSNDSFNEIDSEIKKSLKETN